MANISKYQEIKWLQSIKDNTPHIGLINDTANEAELEGDTPLASEITGYIGNRKAITFGAITKTGTDPSQMTGPPVVAIDFENMPAPVGREIKYFVICDADIGGNVLKWSEIIGGPVEWTAGDTFRIPIDNITVKLD